jgi:hypothetical protein
MQKSYIGINKTLALLLMTQDSARVSERTASALSTDSAGLHLLFCCCSLVDSSSIVSMCVTHSPRLRVVDS